MNIHAPKEAVEFFGQFQFVGKIYIINNEKYIKVKLKQPMTIRKSYFYSFKLNLIGANIKELEEYGK